MLPFSFFWSGAAWASSLDGLGQVDGRGLERAPQDPARTHITFYGSSFIADAQGAIVAEAARDADAILTAEFDLDALASARAAWGVFRDRRPELYGALVSHDGAGTRR